MIVMFPFPDYKITRVVENVEKEKSINKKTKQNLLKSPEKNHHYHFFYANLLVFFYANSACTDKCTQTHLHTHM